MNSVVVTAYNVEREVKEQILGILSGINEDVDFVFVNDGSTDKTGEVADSFLETISSDFVNQITFVSAHHVGYERARKIGAIHAKSDDILYIDIRKE